MGESSAGFAVKRVSKFDVSSAGIRVKGRGVRVRGIREGSVRVNTCDMTRFAVKRVLKFDVSSVGVREKEGSS